MSNSDFKRIAEGDWEDYTWGRITNVWVIESYGIIQYENREREICYHPYVRGWINDRNLKSNKSLHDTSHSYLNLEGALAGAMAYKWDGLNSQASSYFCKMIEVEND